MLKRLVPRRLREALRSQLQLRQLARGLGALTPGRRPDEAQLIALSEAWGRDGWSAADVSLTAIAEHAAATEGPILECGSGLSTLLMGALAGRRGVPVYSLEHHPKYHARVARLLRRLRLTNVNLILAPLRPYDGFEWYDVPADGLPADFRLVVCDGPPSQTAGGRYGLLPVMGRRFAPGAVLLLDDVDRPEEQQILRRWAAGGRVRVESELAGAGTSVAVCTVVPG
ncbi:MAG: class I SAM-dependent methyltransferase [Acidobacteriota bacterium]|nr:class I SAM-dependent methyltransferase [Acidobacteriota bacterium]